VWQKKYLLKIIAVSEVVPEENPFCTEHFSAK
jgi:hypothetical protein